MPKKITPEQRTKVDFLIKNYSDNKRQYDLYQRNTIDELVKILGKTGAALELKIDRKTLYNRHFPDKAHPAKVLEEKSPKTFDYESMLLKADNPYAQ